MSIITTLMEFGLPTISVGLLGGAVAAFVYIPLVGRFVAAGLVAVAAGTFAFDQGYVMRGQQDQTAKLRVQLANANEDIEALQKNADDIAKVADQAAQRERAALDDADNAQEMVRRYAAQISSRKDPACILSAADVGGLSAIGGPHTRHRVAPAAK